MRYFRLLAILTCSMFWSPYTSSTVVVGDAGYKGLKLTNQDVLLIFTGQITKIKGKNITIITFDRTAIQHQIFVYQILGMTTYQYESSLNRQIYTGKISSPREVKSDQEMINAIKNTPNSIGYLSDRRIIRNEKNIVVIIIIK